MMKSEKRITVTSQWPMSNSDLRHRCSEYAAWYHKPSGLCLILTDDFKCALPDNGFGVYAYDVECLDQVKKVLDCEPGIVLTAIAPLYLQGASTLKELERRARLCIEIKPE